MAVLHHRDSGRMATLGARTTIGRSSVCTLRLPSRRASGEHASLAWSGTSWRLRDLGSRNGTWLGERRLAPGEEVAIARGDRVAFGDVADWWQLVDDRPPEPFARCEADERTVDADGGVLALPSPEDPQVMVFRTGGGWVAEDGDGGRPVSDQALLSVGEAPWRLFLPVVIETTLLDDGSGPGPSLTGLHLKVRVSRDQEFVTLDLAHDGAWTRVPPRAYHYMLVVLAQAWLDAPGADPAERGWVSIDTVADALQVEPRTVGAYVCRLRQQFGRLGISDAGLIIERRPGLDQLRIGLPSVDLGEL